MWVIHTPGWSGPVLQSGHIATPADLSAAYFALGGEENGDAPASVATPYALSPGDSFGGFLSSGDEDWIEVTLTAGESYEFLAYGEGETALPDTILRLYDSSGGLLAENDDAGPGGSWSAQSYTPGTTITAYLSVSAAGGTATGGYRLSLYNDPAPAIATATSMALGQDLAGYLSAGDSDWVAISLAAGVTYDLALYGTGLTAITDTFLSLHDGSGAVVAENDDATASTLHSALTYTATASGTYYIEAEGFDSGQFGSYGLVAVEDASADVNTTAALTFGQLYRSILTENDGDWVAFTAEAGKTYSLHLSGQSEMALADPLLRLRDANGGIIASNDDHAVLGPDSYLTFTAAAGGTYFAEIAGAQPGDGGLYTLLVEDQDAATPVNAVTWQGAALDTTDPVRVFFAGTGVDVNHEGRIYTSDGFDQAEIDAMMAVLYDVSKFADIQFVSTTDQAQADFQIALADLDGNALGFMTPQGSTAFSDGVAVIDNGPGWTTAALAPGGAMYARIVHEFGHGLGLAHGHDYGGGSGLLHGVFQASDLGDHDLNQAPFTAMSYNDYWDGHSLAAPGDDGSGYLQGFGALDIAALQAIYGATSNHATGDTVYRLDHLTGLSTIWDSGGVDTIANYDGKDTVIDLRAATLTYEVGGGGWVSQADGGYGGFTIAAGVVIENGFAGTGDDTIYGNDGYNTLQGGKGRDVLWGFGGNDGLRGGHDNDVLYGGDGDDWLTPGTGWDMVHGDGGDDTVYGWTGNDLIFGGWGYDFLDGGPDDDTIWGGREGDQLIGGAGNDWLSGDRGDDRIWGGSGDDTLIGGDGDDQLDGNGGVDSFVFDLDDGADLITGFSEDDVIDLRGLGLGYGDLGVSVTGSTGTVTFGATTLSFATLTADLDASDFLFV